MSSGTLYEVGIDEWIYSTLAADTTIKSICGTPTPRIYSDVAPQTSSWPAIVFRELSGKDTLGAGAGRIMGTASYRVIAIDQTESLSANVKTLAQRVDALLCTATTPTWQPKVVGGVTILGCYRTAEIGGIEEAWNTVFRRLGGLYTILTN